MKVTWRLLEVLLLRFLSKPQHWHGTVTLKFYNGKISSCCPQDSMDLRELNELNLTVDPDLERVLHINYKGDTMFKKFGTSNIKAEDGKLQSKLELDEETKLVKESSLKNQTILKVPTAVPSKDSLDTELQQPQN